MSFQVFVCVRLSGAKGPLYSPPPTPRHGGFWIGFPLCCVSRGLPKASFTDHPGHPTRVAFVLASTCCCVTRVANSLLHSAGVAQPGWLLCWHSNLFVFRKPRPRPTSITCSDLSPAQPWLKARLKPGLKPWLKPPVQAWLKPRLKPISSPGSSPCPSPKSRPGSRLGFHAEAQGLIRARS